MALRGQRRGRIGVAGGREGIAEAQIFGQEIAVERVACPGRVDCLNRDARTMRRSAAVATRQPLLPSVSATTFAPSPDSGRRCDVGIGKAEKLFRILQTRQRDVGHRHRRPDHRAGPRQRPEPQPQIGVEGDEHAGARPAMASKVASQALALIARLMPEACRMRAPAM
jgi:hypothetical protein